MARPPLPLPTRRRAAPWTACAAALAALALGVPAAAQVLEIGDDGGVAVYAGPTVFTQSGAAPIAPPVAAPAIRRSRPAPVAKATVMRELSAAAETYALSPALVHAVALRESGLRQDALSPAGATGVMQLMPGTARQLGVDPTDRRQNIYGGAAYLARMINEFGGDVTLGLAAYNAGPAAVRRYRGVPPFAETRSYVAAILDRLADQAILVR